MTFTNAEVRAYARERLKGNWLYGVAVTFIVSFISGTASGLNFLWLKWVIAGAIVSIIIAIALIPLTVSVAYVYLKFSRGDKLEFEGLGYGYKNGLFLKSIVLTILTGFFVFLWSLLLIIPGIIKAISYSLAPYVLVDNPNLGWRECLAESEKLTSGYKGQMFMLSLSFIGWLILCVFTFGIGYFFLNSYIQTSFANFYDRRKIDVYGLPEENIEEEPFVKW